MLVHDLDGGLLYCIIEQCLSSFADDIHDNGILVNTFSRTFKFPYHHHKKLKEIFKTYQIHTPPPFPQHINVHTQRSPKHIYVSRLNFLQNMKSHSSSPKHLKSHPPPSPKQKIPPITFYKTYENPPHHLLQNK